MESLSKKSRLITRYEKGVVTTSEDEVVVEWPITIVLNGEEFATLVCSPEHIEELAVGYLASEGVLADYADLKDMSYDDRSGMVYADIEGVDPWIIESGSKRVLTSCCGKSRQSFVFYGDLRTAKPIESRKLRISYASCVRMMEAMQAQSGVFRATGGVHNAALFDRDGALLLARMDIGRHNAIDKLYGHCLRNQVTMTDKVLAFSGRVSSEVLIKAAKMGCEALLSKSAVTELAIELADGLGITVVGFIRHGSLNVYTHPERLFEGE
ncbi:formate dehydrogenase accessory sulfurtransferase FdhD [Cohnella endophytica]|uniref:Sulfur carrier protein FdhD n=1 Tax=Cohnella endophytica TaxID=2419778 RepID=A0A494XRF3_9BACL|nr:formate dehydrogenase accessory sulfurtransferase FdhD [Cohnella endophytica]RKP50093.1 formate dehydrogenase accessory sulfurtransferase FdhD [Cohnella endophytica]